MSHFNFLLWTAGKKFEIVAHQFLQHAGQVKEHPKIIKVGKQKPAPPPFNRKPTESNREHQW